MTSPIATILEQNRRWVAETLARDPEHFSKLAGKQEPKFLFVGCSDSRVPANVITGTSAGEMFVHRNIANQVIATDLNVLSVVEYAVDVLGVQDLIVCGHQGCGGVRAAIGSESFGLLDNWLNHIRGVIRLHRDELDALPHDDARWVRLVELNVIEQAYNLGQTPAVQRAWAAGKPLRVHGLVYDIRDGLLRDLDVTIEELAASRGQRFLASGGAAARSSAPWPSSPATASASP